MVDFYQVYVSDETEDPEWDTFLAQNPGGHHVQTSLWAQVKAVLGWRAVRIIARQNGQIIGGAQILIRSIPLIGAIGYVTRGPVLALDDLRLAHQVIDELHTVAQAQGIRYLVVQPPCNGEALARELPGWGFQPSPIAVGTTATVVIDLSRDLEAILAQMKPRTRYNVRLGPRKGITVREGTESDLPTYYRLLVATSQRQNFAPYPEKYFAAMWRVFSPHGYVRLFLADHEGEPVSALLAIPFGDTLINKLAVWSGRHGDCRPNELLQWTAITWAKSHGYRYYDFEGIDPQAAREILNGNPLPDALSQSTTSFKLGFGGQVVLYPGAYEYVYNPVLRWTYSAVFPKIASLPVAKKAVNRLRTG